MNRSQCPHCQRWYDRNALGNHQPACAAQTVAAASRTSDGTPVAGRKRPRLAIQVEAPPTDRRPAMSDGGRVGPSSGRKMPDASDLSPLTLRRSTEASSVSGGIGAGDPGGGESDSNTSDDTSGAGDVAETDGSSKLDEFIRNPSVLSNAIMADAAARAGLSRSQVQIVLDAIHEPGFDASKVLGSAPAVCSRLDSARAVFAGGREPYARVDIPIDGLVLPRSAPLRPFAIVFDAEAAITAVMRDPEIVSADRLVLDVTTAEPSRLPREAAISAGSACLSPVGRAMDAASRKRLIDSPEALIHLLAHIQLDESNVSVFGNVSLFPVVLILLSLNRPCNCIPPHRPC